MFVFFVRYSHWDEIQSYKDNLNENNTQQVAQEDYNR